MIHFSSYSASYHVRRDILEVADAGIKSIPLRYTCYMNHAKGAMPQIELQQN